MLYNETYLQQLTLADIISEPDSSKLQLIQEYVQIVDLALVSDDTLLSIISIYYEHMENDDSCFSIMFQQLSGISIPAQTSKLSAGLFLDVLRYKDYELLQLVADVAWRLNDKRTLVHVLFLDLQFHIGPKLVFDFIGDTSKTSDSDIVEYYDWLRRFKWTQECIVGLLAAGHTIKTLYKRKLPIQAYGAIYPYEGVPEKLHIFKRDEVTQCVDLPQYDKEIDKKDLADWRIVMVTCLLKLTDECYCDIQRGNIKFRVFYTERFVIVLRPDIAVDNKTPWAPIIQYVSDKPMETYEQYAKVIRSLCVSKPKEIYFQKEIPVQNRRNFYGTKYPEAAKQLIQEKYKSWYTLKCMPIGGI